MKGDARVEMQDRLIACARATLLQRVLRGATVQSTPDVEWRPASVSGQVTDQRQDLQEALEEELGCDLRQRDACAQPAME